METKSAQINMRVPPSVRDIIDYAANISNIERSTFIQQAALREAQAILANRRDFLLEESAFEAFEKALDEPAKTNKALEGLFKRGSPWS